VMRDRVHRILLADQCDRPACRATRDTEHAYKIFSRSGRSVPTEVNRRDPVRSQSVICWYGGSGH